MNTKKTITVMGVLFILAGLAGFAAPGLMGMPLSTAHNLVHLVSGILALYFGVKGTPHAARIFALVFGAVYGLLGVAGLLASGADGMLTIIPNQLMFGMADNIVHVIPGAVFLLAGLVRTHPELSMPRQL